ncbi:hypothetical protein ACIPY6_40480 [Streptomyces sp. NPDC090054]
MDTAKRQALQKDLRALAATIRADAERTSVMRPAFGVGKPTVNRPESRP